MRNTFKLIFLFALLLFSAARKTKAQNIALHKSYTLSRGPNYKGTAPGTDKTSLTDGVIFDGKNFVKQQTILGWQSVSQITIMMDLQKVQIVKSVAFNAFQNSKVDIHTPSDIFVFLSEDNSNFIYAGNAASNTGKTLLTDSKLKLTLDNINQKAQYVTLAVIPSGKFTFCDEIEIEQGNKLNAVNSNKITKEGITDLTDSLINISYKKNQAVAELDAITASNQFNAALNANSVSSLKSQIENSNATQNFLDNARNQIDKYHAHQLKQKFNTPYVVEGYNPWDTLSPYYFPSGQQKLNYDFTIPENGTDYGSFVVTNTTDLTQKFTFGTQSINTAVAGIELFNVPFIPAADYKMIPDPLVPIMADGISIEPGNSRLIIFKIKGSGSGDIQPVIAVTGKEKTVSIAARVKVIALKGFDDVFTLNANIWAYFDYPMLRDSKPQASIDLKKHYINTIVIPSSVLPKIGETDTKELDSYLVNAKFARKILVAPQFKSPNKRSFKNVQFLSSEWKSNFLNWYKAVWQTIKKYGFTDSQIYLYPYDEVRGNDINDDAALITWIKQEAPELRVYGTIVSTDAEAISRILPLLDIAQVQLKGKNSNGVTYPVHKTEIWLYKNSPTSRSESPYSHYRLMAWEAFLNDYTGIGFWSYASDKKQKFISDPFIDADADFSVIYNDKGNSIISSRRWDAFSLGIEDYQILYLYGKKYGIEKAKELAKKVMNNPTNFNLANEVKTTMILALEK
ncbi:MAG TPA: hypothetical protein VFW07_05105 [Parafilimonas sp.]|nr:hypothetical protein [Parafilimonas sp.]